LLFLHCTALAQFDQVPSVNRVPLEPHEEERPRLPEYERPRAPPSVVLPEAPRPRSGTAQDLPALARVSVREIELTGNTVFSTAELAQYTKPYVGRQITFEDLQAVSHALTLHYIQRGYVNSGAVVPDQVVRNGVITIQIVEGRLTRIEVEGNKWLRTRYLQERLALYAGPPLNVQQLQEGLRLLNEEPTIERINAELRPGLRAGEAVLRVRVEEASPATIGVEFNNYQSPSIGSEGGRVTLIHRSLTGNADTLLAHYDVREGLNDVEVNYAFPITARDTAIELRFRNSSVKVIEEPFADLDIDSNIELYGVTLAHPLYRSPGRELRLALAFEHRRSSTSLLDEPFSFSPGVVDGRSVVSALRLSQEWTQRSQNQVLAARSRFSVGVDVLGATNNSSSLPDAQFRAWLGQLQWARRFGDRGFQTIARLDIQLTPDRLLPLEQLSVGGHDTVRAYREYLLVRDNGVIGSLEARIPIWQTARGNWTIQLAPFADFAGAWAAHGPTPDPKAIGSLGVGLLGTAMGQLHFELYWGVPLERVSTPGGDLQDDGIYFQLASEFALPEHLVDWLALWR
jgi:hemolysin activation/secretion protein